MTIRIEKPKEIQRVREAGRLAKELGTAIAMKPNISNVEFISSPAVEKNKVSVTVKGRKKDIEEIVRDAVEETVMMRGASWKI